MLLLLLLLFFIIVVNVASLLHILPVVVANAEAAFVDVVVAVVFCSLRCCCRCCCCCLCCCCGFIVMFVRPVWITFLCYNFSVVAVFTAIYSKTAVNGQLSLLKSYPNWPYLWLRLWLWSLLLHLFGQTHLQAALFIGYAKVHA